MTKASLLAPLAAYVAAVQVDLSDGRLRDRLWTTMLDWTTALFAGTGHPLAESYGAALLDSAETGSARVAADPYFHPVASAMMMNAVLSHLWEVDDAHRTSTSHPGITVLPVVMALAQVLKLPAVDAAAALVAGVEAGIRIGAHLGPAHYALCHTTATAGTFGAAAAAARALGLDAGQTLSAFGHAGTQAAGLWQFLDDGLTAPKALHVATAVRNGLAAARMAKAGIAGAPAILEGPRGMRAAWRLEGLDDGWLQPGAEPIIHEITVKAWPVCGQMHSALDCAQSLAARDPDAGRQAQRVIVEVPKSTLAIAGIANPTTLSEAKFSTVLCVAAALLGHTPDFAGFTETLLTDRDVRDLAGRVELRADGPFTARFPKERPARVTVELDGARTLVEERSFRKGDPEAPWTRSEMIVRSRSVLDLSASAVDLDGLLDWCGGFASADPDWSAATLFDLIEVQ
jgi:2-methylcitrate dehydratase PrpD